MIAEVMYGFWVPMISMAAIGSCFPVIMGFGRDDEFEKPKRLWLVCSARAFGHGPRG